MSGLQGVFPHELHDPDRDLPAADFIDPGALDPADLRIIRQPLPGLVRNWRKDLLHLIAQPLILFSPHARDRPFSLPAEALICRCQILSCTR